MPGHPALARMLLVPPDHRARFVSNLRSILGDVRFLWMPGTIGTTESDLSGRGHVLTHSASTSGRLTQLGRGLALSFNGSSEYVSVPVADSLQFGNGVTDTPLSIVVLGNVTDTAAGRMFISSNSGAAPANQFWFALAATDELRLVCADGVTASAFRTGDTAAIMGAWTLYGGTYDGRGGATAADGMTLYQNGGAIASTATNSASYVAMEATTTGPNIGASLVPHAYVPGSMALVAVCQKALSADEHAAVKTLVNAYFGLSL